MQHTMHALHPSARLPLPSLMPASHCSPLHNAACLLLLAMLPLQGGGPRRCPVGLASALLGRAACLHWSTALRCGLKAAVKLKLRA